MGVSSLSAIASLASKLPELRSRGSNGREEGRTDQSEHLLRLGLSLLNGCSLA